MRDSGRILNIHSTDLVDVISDIRQFREWRSTLNQTTSVALVPTMGALHEGHASLIRDAASTATETVVSIFVNRIQFNDAADYAKYPKTLDADLEIAAAAGSTVVFVPKEEEIGPLLQGAPMRAGAIGTLWEGADRPGHFDGVLTVVNQLFSIVQPSRARFGEKDRQQLTIITQWARKAWSGLVIDHGPTVRDEDGLALSSRNRRLSPSGRKEALSINRSLRAIATLHGSGIVDVGALLDHGRSLLSPKLDVHYLAIVDSETLNPIDEARFGSIVLIAASVDGVRLLDNLELS